MRASRCSWWMMGPRMGRPGCWRGGLAGGAGRGIYTIIQDADLEYDPGDYPRLIEPLRAGWARVVYGSRYLFPKWYGSRACGSSWHGRRACDSRDVKEAGGAGHGLETRGTS